MIFSHSIYWTLGLQCTYFHGYRYDLKAAEETVKKLDALEIETKKLENEEKEEKPEKQNNEQKDKEQEKKEGKQN